MIGPAQVAALRQTAESYMPDPCEIRRLETTEDPWGGETSEWVTVAETRARVKPVGSGSERVVADRIEAVSPVTVVLPAGTDVHHTDRLLVAGAEYEVRGIVHRSEAYEAQRSAVCERR